MSAGFFMDEKLYMVRAYRVTQQDMVDTAFKTTSGNYEAAWSEKGLGYSFQTPEAWNLDDEYRSLAYMRPLAIWAMQWALTRPKLPEQQVTRPEVDEISLLKHHVSLSRVARLLKLLVEAAPKGLLQVAYDSTCKRIWM